MKGWTEEAVKAYQQRTGAEIMAPQSQIFIAFRFIIGIDCGVTTGLAAWDRPGKGFAVITSGTITQMFRKILLLRGQEWNIYVRFEDARLRKYIPAMPNEKRERGRREGAGSVKRDAKIWEDFLLEEGIQYEAVAPKDNTTKLTQVRFRKMTGWGPITNEHERDAAMLVFQLNN